MLGGTNGGVVVLSASEGVWTSYTSGKESMGLSLFCFIFMSLLPSLLCSFACSFDFPSLLANLSFLHFFFVFEFEKLGKQGDFLNLTFPFCACDFKNKFPIWLFKSISLPKERGESMLDIHLGIHAQGGPHFYVCDFSSLSPFSFLLLISLQFHLNVGSNFE